MSDRKTKQAGTLAGICLLLFLSACTAVHPENGTNRVAKAPQKPAAITVQAEQEEEPQTAAEQPVSAPSPEEPAAVFFASDYQFLAGWPFPSETLRWILETVEEDGRELDGLVYCGDYSNVVGYSNYGIDPEEDISEIREIVYDVFPALEEKEDSVLFVQGNHDILTGSIAASGLHEYDSYLVYVVNTQNDFPWKQGLEEGSREKVENTAALLDKCLQELAERGERRPVFIAAHVPLHFTGRTSSLYGVGDNMYAAALFEVLNAHGDELDLIYLHGHNHSKGWDSYMGGSSAFRTKGDLLLVPEAGPEEDSEYTDRYTAETLHFTYLNAGFTGYYTGSGADNTLTGTVCVVFPDYLEFTRYDAEGVHLLSSEGGPNRWIDDSKLIPAEYYGTELESPVRIPRMVISPTP